MSWTNLRSEVQELFGEDSGIEYGELNTVICRNWRPDPHKEADHFLSASEWVREALRGWYEEQRVAKVSAALQAPKNPPPRRIRRKYRDATYGRNLMRVSGKVTSEVADKIRNLSHRMPVRQIALELDLSPRTVARSLGKPWALEATGAPCGRKPKIQWPSPEILAVQVWQIPMERLAKVLGVSSRSIAKHCIRRGITFPGPGHWTKVQRASMYVAPAP